MLDDEGRVESIGATARSFFASARWNLSVRRLVSVYF